MSEKLKKYESGINPADGNAAAGWMFCQRGQAGPSSRRKSRHDAAFMEQLRHLDKMKVPLLLEGITLTTNGTAGGYPIESVQELTQFDGTKFVPIGGVIKLQARRQRRKADAEADRTGLSPARFVARWPPAPLIGTKDSAAVCPMIARRSRRACATDEISDKFRYRQCACALTCTLRK